MLGNLSSRRSTRLVVAVFLVTLMLGCAQAEPAPTKGAVVTPAPTPSPAKEWELEDVQVELPTATVETPTLDSIVSEVLGVEAEHYGVVVERLDGKGATSHNPEKVFYAASLFKLPVMVEAFRQREAGLLGFDEEMVVTEEYALEDLGTLDPLGIKVGDRLSVGRMVELMVVKTDNTSANMLLDLLGQANVDRTARELGLRVTSVATRELPTTAADMALLLKAIAEGRAVGQEASTEMESLLLRQHWRARIPAGVPGEVSVGNKTGSWEGATHDVAIVYAPSGTYILVVLSNKSWEVTPIVELSRRVYGYYEGRVR